MDCGLIFFSDSYSEENSQLTTLGQIHQRLSEPQYTPVFCWFVEKGVNACQSVATNLFENLIVTQHDLNFKSGFAEFVEVVSDW